MAPKRKRETELSQAEVWDDSALIRSWDEALEEYKMYHSIHARGEDVGQILEGLKKQKLLESSMGATGPEEATKEDASLEEAEEGEIDNQPEEIDTSKARDIPMETTTVEAEASNGQDTTPDINGIDLPRDQTAPQIGQYGVSAVVKRNAHIIITNYVKLNVMSRTTSLYNLEEAEVRHGHRSDCTSRTSGPTAAGFAASYEANNYVEERHNAMNYRHDNGANAVDDCRLR
ncbi:MAG: hypothetical protein M1814_004299 [Vezdaea aestivalis]|nr:MAG: hypothetical protein M1814_004299 [Vezdaea aestivalis]